MASDPFCWYLIGIFVAALLGAIPPLLGRWSSRQLHLFIALGAGVFLGAVFLHILPEVEAEGFGRSANTFIIVGFLAVLLIERVLLSRHEQACDGECPHGHEVLGWTALIGLLVHSFTEGLGLGMGVTNPKLGFALFLSIIAHKSIAAFSLATVFRLAGFSTHRSVGFLSLFALTTPAAALIAIVLLQSLPVSAAYIPAALAAGTFLYIATCDLLPEAFHDKSNRVTAFLALLFGIIIMFGITHFG